MSDSSARAARGAVKINGTLINGWCAFEVDNNSYASADTFSVSFAANDLPSDRSAAWFAQQENMHVELFAGVPANPQRWTLSELPPSWIYGQADKIEHDIVRGVIKVSGRDLTRVFIDAKTTEKFQNKTSSQIATILAQRHGLTASVTATTTPVGKYYEIDHETMNDARTEWDILTHLARIEQFVVYVRGQTLYFQPRPDPSKVQPYRIVWTPPDPRTGYPTCDVDELEFARSLTVSRGIVVVVRSFNDAEGRPFHATFPANSVSEKSKSSSPWGGPQTYYYNVANLTQQKCQQYAQAKYLEIVQHEMLMQASLPGAGNDALDTTSVIQVSGTGCAWDQMYFPESITRSLSFDGGYTLELHAKNHAPESMERQ